MLYGSPQSLGTPPPPTKNAPKSSVMIPAATATRAANGFKPITVLPVLVKDEDAFAPGVYKLAFSPSLLAWIERI